MVKIALLLLHSSDLGGAFFGAQKEKLRRKAVTILLFHQPLEVLRSYFALSVVKVTKCFFQCTSS